MKLIPSNFKEQILTMLKDGLKPSEISKLLNLNYVSTQQMCNRLGYTFTYNHGNNRYFQNIDTNVKAYMLGFITADGAIVNDTLTITIHTKDRCILETLKSEIGCENPIREIHTKMSFDCSRQVDHVRFTITDKLIISDLNNLGIYPRKSLTMENIIINIPKEFRKPFIIGYFDGDGSVTLPKGKVKFQKHTNSYILHPSHCLLVQFRGTKELLLGITNELEIPTHFYQRDSIGSLIISDKLSVIKFFNCYKDLTFFLRRKYNKFLMRIDHPSFQKLIQD